MNSHYSCEGRPECVQEPVALMGQCCAFVFGVPAKLPKTRGKTWHHRAPAPLRGGTRARL